MKLKLENLMFNNFNPLLENVQQNNAPEVELSDDTTIDPDVAIETLERRILELEAENKMLRTKDSRPWCFDLKQPGHIRGGLTSEEYCELDLISKHFNSKTNSHVWLMMAHCWQSPIPTREKLILFFLCLVNAKAVEQTPKF